MATKTISSYRIQHLFGFYVLFNLLFLSCLGASTRTTWSRKASVEAEAVAALFCSGHRRAFLDGLILQSGKPICECNACYAGPRCSKFLPDCAVDVSNGDPVFLEPF